MLRDYENIDDVNELPDPELAAVARDRLSEYDDVDLDRIEVTARDGVVRLSGSVGTEADYQRAERILTDVVGFERVETELIIDELERDTYPEEADVAAAALDTRDAQPGGADRTTDEAAHLRPNEAAEQFGTRDTGTAIERGYSYEPPDGPIQEGTSREQH